MHGLTSSHSSLGRYHEAMHLYKRTLELCKHIFDDKHPNTLESMNSIAASYFNLALSKKSMRLQKQTLELRKRILDNKHFNIL